LRPGSVSLEQVAILQGFSILQHCNNTLQQHTATHCNTLQNTAKHCNTLRHAATHCNTLRHNATGAYSSFGSQSKSASEAAESAESCYDVDSEHNILGIIATHCTKLQRSATNCNSMQRSVTHCYALQLTATHCNSLQLTATHCNSLQPAQILYDKDFTECVIYFGIIARIPEILMSQNGGYTQPSHHELPSRTPPKDDASNFTHLCQSSQVPHFSE